MDNKIKVRVWFTLNSDLQKVKEQLVSLNKGGNITFTVVSYLDI